MPQPREPNPTITILCPLAIEAKAARSAVRALARAGITVTTTGPGQTAIRTAVQHAINNQPRPTRLILFGTCGGLRPIDTRNHNAITEVKDESGRRWTPPMKLRGNPRTLLSVASPLFSVTAKQAAGETFHADLVDCESAAFADSCQSAGARWGIVRGISDDFDDELPEEAATWIDTSGTTRAERVLLDCLRSPRLIPRVVRLGRRSGATLREAGAQLRAMIEAELKTEMTAKGCDA